MDAEKVPEEDEVSYNLAMEQVERDYIPENEVAED